MITTERARHEIHELIKLVASTGKPSVGAAIRHLRADGQLNRARELAQLVAWHRQAVPSLDQPILSPDRFVEAIERDADAILSEASAH